MTLFKKGQTLGMIFQKILHKNEGFLRDRNVSAGWTCIVSVLQRSADRPWRAGSGYCPRVVKIPDGIMIRTFEQKEVESLAKFGSIPVINGLTDFCHPVPDLSGPHDDPRI